ncbi:V-type H+-transporting ATPase 16kDa proteolipid subunit [Nematocida major]|uniref:V-type H+-transporting ATPase 16kDa proteolipid subunit n=1 Tax=Nematocida major TaxID=1912982 RepID=UPI002008348E|nr:V-type H+-transporting ATPase 16kDa proteolipid subunit [Nematocida major]KAH9386020.1 V-type H+-transporting ATPase 16kDa proteolipid subunit [Nematocida major]
MDENAELNRSVVPFVIGTFSIVIMLAASAVGATVGAAMSASSAAIVANRGTDLITKSYLPVLFASAGFMYAIIVSFLSISRMTEDVSLKTASTVMAACFVYGGGALFSGMAIGKANKYAIVKMSEDRRIFLASIIINSTIEIPAVFSLICAVMILARG